MQIAMENFFLPEFLDFCRKKLRQKVLCNGALVVDPCTKFDENPPRGSWDFVLTR